ncbi:hypothetical protein HPP92_019804 [Vanilla planifolia]|uniref:CCT domain-containing protein n=1 Tax=Vanilla planifolia TaxID=51239 RepID=A0A835UK65_VANPL|nr:hypothetical protein HPP92_019804 [Vanilla planifolia]
MNGSFSPAESPLLTDVSAATGKYACRKTLADSRLRVRGRFARNGEAEHEAEYTENGFRCWKSCDFDGEYGGGDCWIQMQEMLPTSGEENWDYDEDLWAGLGGVFGMDDSRNF